jgi:formylmethanofuran dehydrogenase subunit B
VVDKNRYTLIRTKSRNIEKLQTITITKLKKLLAYNSDSELIQTFTRCTLGKTSKTKVQKFNESNISKTIITMNDFG